MKIGNKLTKQFRKQFESLLPPGIDTTKNKAGDYEHKTTQAMWLGFMLPMQAILPKGLYSSNRYIIAGHDVNGFPVFSTKPRVHNASVAVLEVKRLTETVPGHSFGVYQLVKTVKVPKDKEQILFYEYSRNRVYIHFDENAKFKRFHVTDDFGNAVMPTVMHWFFEGEFIELRKMQGQKYLHKKED